MGAGEGGKSEYRSGQEETSGRVESFGKCVLVRNTSYSSVLSLPFKVIEGELSYSVL